VSTRNQFRRLLIALIILLQITFTGTRTASGNIPVNPPRQVRTSQELAQDLLDQLTPEERVGQLFLIDFTGNNFSENPQLADLITIYHIGGLNLKASNNNISQGENGLLDTQMLIQDIQRAEISFSRGNQRLESTGETYSPSQIPLFIAISQPGNGFPGDQLLQDLTAMPSQLAIGATWDKNLAAQAGSQVAKELNLLGINFLLGPSMNVHRNPRPDLNGDLGVSSFSGSPFWTGEIGQAYITGLHSGSQNRLAVVGTNFPGFVGTDEPVRNEIPTIRKTLDQLLLTELPPYFVITDLGADPNGQVNGLVLTHARYEAFQSDVSTVSPPISLNPQALNQLLSLQDFSAWHTNGGLIISDDLGSQAIRRYYVQIGQKYDPRFIARDALLAGNDLLITGNFISPDDPDLYTSTIRTLQFFAEKYRDDVAFAQRVDEAVLRILTLKYELYGNSFQVNNILTTTDMLEEIGGADQITFEIAQKSATLIDPEVENLNTVLPNPPSASDFITIFTDTVSYQACEDCQIYQAPARTALEEIILRLYGPNGDGLIVPGNVASYTYSDLNEAVSQSTDPESLVIANINRAEWLVFLQTSRDPNRPESQALSRFLSETPELIQDKNIIVFGLGAPYYLNATEISTVTAYYNLYSKQPQFIEVAARLLFKELNPTGASPVTINSIGYVIEQVLTPDSTQVIPLRIGHSESPQLEDENGTPIPPTPFTQGDSVFLEAGTILDYNGHPVPDETLVRFTLISTNQDGVTSQRELTALTTNGVARSSFILDTAGSLEVQASSGEPAATSNLIQIDVTGSGEAAPTPEEDTQQPTEPTPTESGESQTDEDDQPREVNNLVDWLLAMVVISFLSLFAYQFGAMAGQVRWGVRWGLTSLIGGLLVNAYISFNMPGASLLVQEYHIWGIVLGVAGGCLVGWAVGLIWRQLR
jgi:beta-N-acetylhexosaminidase